MKVKILRMRILYNKRLIESAIKIISNNEVVSVVIINNKINKKYIKRAV